MTRRPPKIQVIDDETNLPEHVQAARRRNTKDASVAFKDSFSLHHIIDYLRIPSAGAGYPGRTDIINLLNIIMCKQPNTDLRITAMGGNKLYPATGHSLMDNYDLTGGLEAMRGYYSSVRPTIGRLLVNLNVTSGAFYKPLPFDTLLRDSRGANDGVAVCCGIPRSI